MAAAHVESYGGDDREYRQAREQTGRRLTAAEIEPLQQLWRERPGDVGLASTFGAQMSRLQSLSPKEARKDPAQEAPAADDLGARAAAALAAWQLDHPEHVTLGLPPAELPAVMGARVRPRRIRYLLGARVARGYVPDYIHCHASTSGCARLVTVETRDGHGCTAVELVEAPTTLERWVEGRPGRTGWRPARSKKLEAQRAAWAALGRMIAAGRGQLVRALWLVYGADLPATEWPQFGDAAPLVLDAPLVLRHADRLTQQLRACVGPTCRQTVTPRAALRDLLSGASLSAERTAEARQVQNRIRAQAEAILWAASAAYRETRH